ncbi:MAG TPA: hypothetical protein VFW39_01585 [Sphingomicrobium sp.]|nr:hypothetical protein [Sphingomicrobium sp.]
MKEIARLAFAAAMFLGTCQDLSATPVARPTYLGLHLGQSQAEVKYLLGYPPNVIDSEASKDAFGGYLVYQTDGRDPINKMPAGKSINDFLKWSYSKPGGRIDLAFSRDRDLEEITCYSNEFRMCPPLYGVSVGQSEASVLAELGEPSSSHLDGVAKVLNYVSFGLTLTLTQGRVYMITLRR